MLLGRQFNHRDVSLIKARRMIYKMTSKVKVENLNSGQGHDLTQTWYATYHSIRLDRTNTSNLFWSLYLVSIKNNCDNIGDLWWSHATSNAHCRGHRCICQLRWLVNTTFCMFWLLRMILTQIRMKWNISHLFITVRSQNWPDLRTKIWKIRDIHFANHVTLNKLWRV